MTEQEKPKTSKEAIAAIIMAGIVIVMCILSCTVVAVTFLMNAPW